MSRHKVEKSSWSTHKKDGHVDPHFRELYEKIDRLVRAGKTKEEILNFLNNYS